MNQGDRAIEARAGGLLERLTAWFGGRSELAALPSDEVARMAHDLGMSSGELRELAAKGPHAADLLHVRMQALGITEADIARMSLGLMRDLERDCACCASKVECREDLLHDQDSPGWMAYCANAQTLEAARSARGRAPV